jgi:fatty acid desaturase
MSNMTLRVNAISVSLPFYNLPKLREAIKHDLPPAPNGLWVTWKELLAIHRRQQDDPDYYMEVALPEPHGEKRASVDDFGGEQSVT